MTRRAVVWTLLLVAQHGCALALDWDAVERRHSIKEGSARSGDDGGAEAEAGPPDAGVDAAPSCVQYLDLDGDSYGDPARVSTSCETQPDYVSDARDCDDDNAGSHPTAAETCDGVDQNCDGEIDEGACPDGCVGTAYEGRSFMGCGEHLSYDDAALACSEHAMQLADIYDAAENLYLHDFARAQGITVNMTGGVPDPYVWIGGSDRVEEGLWRHEDGQFFWRGDALGMALGHYYNWSGGEPNNDANPGEEDCLAMRDDDSGRWNDFSCSNLAGFLCATPAR
jgi:hypothetical protein